MTKKLLFMLWRKSHCGNHVPIAFGMITICHNTFPSHLPLFCDGNVFWQIENAGNTEKKAVENRDQEYDSLFQLEKCNIELQSFVIVQQHPFFQFPLTKFPIRSGSFDSICSHRVFMCVQFSGTRFWRMTTPGLSITTCLTTLRRCGGTTTATTGGGLALRWMSGELQGGLRGAFWYK